MDRGPTSCLMGSFVYRTLSQVSVIDVFPSAFVSNIDGRKEYGNFNSMETPSLFSEQSVSTRALGFLHERHRGHSGLSNLAFRK